MTIHSRVAQGKLGWDSESVVDRKPQDAFPQDEEKMKEINDYELSNRNMIFGEE